MVDYTLSAKGVYNGSNFDKGIRGSERALDGFKQKCSTVSIAAGNIIADMATKGLSAITSSTDAAIARVDQLNQFPKVMKNLGYEADQSKAVISKLSDGIEGLPTTLNGIVGNAQSLVLSLKDLDKASDVAIALNDGFLTYGASTEQVTNAIVQLNQMVTAGKYDMQSWNSINQAAPGFLDAVARSMLGNEKRANDLRDALNKGKITSEDFLDQIIRLDKEGADGIVAFSKSAQDAVGGIQTSMSNAQTALTKNVANVIDAFNGSGAIAEFFDMVKGKINETGKELIPFAEQAGNTFADILKGKNDTVNGLIDTAKTVKAHLEPTFTGVRDSALDAFGDIIPLVEDLAPAAIEGAESIIEIGGVLVTGAAEIVSTIASYRDEVMAVVDGIGEFTAPAREAIHGLVGDIDAGSSSAKDAASSATTLAAGLALSAVAMRKNADGLSLLDRGYARAKTGADALKATTSGFSSTFVKYQSAWRDNRQVLLEWNKATQSYVETNKPMRASLAATSAGIKVQTAAMKAGAVATKVFTVAANALKGALKTIAPVAVITGILEIANALGRAREDADTFRTATKGLDAISSYSEAFNAAAGKANNYGSSLKDVKADARKVIDEQAELAKSIEDAWSDVGAKNGAVEKYKQDIEELAGKSGLTADEQARLEAAVSGINTICDTTYTVIDKQNGVLSDNKDAILDVAEAWQQNALKQAAANASVELMEQILKDQAELAKVKQELETADPGNGIWIGDFAVAADEASVKYHELSKQSEDLEESIRSANDEMNRINGIASASTEAFNGTAKAMADYMSTTEGFSEHLEGIDVSGFAGKLKDLGFSVQDVQGMSWEAFDALVECYRNGWANVEQVCADAGITIPEQAKQATQQAMQGVDQAVQEGTPPIEESAQQAGAALPEGITDGTQGAADVMSETVNGVADAAGQLEGKVEENTAGTGSGIAGGILAAQEPAVAAADALSKLVADHLSANTVDAWFAGQSMADNAAQGIYAGQDAASAAARMVSKLVADHFSWANGDAWWAGYNMSEGMANGISSGTSLAVEAARRMAAEAVQAAKDEAEVNSPSKKMIPVGHAMPEGVAVGNAKGTHLAVNAAVDMVRSSIRMAKLTAQTEAKSIQSVQIPLYAPLEPMSSRVTIPTHQIGPMEGSWSGSSTSSVNFYMTPSDEEVLYSMVVDRLRQEGVI